MNYTKLSPAGDLLAVVGGAAAIPVVGPPPPTHIAELAIPTNTDGSAFSYGRIPQKVFKPGQATTITVERDSLNTEILPTIDAAVYEDASGFYWVVKLANDPRVVGSVNLRITVTQ